MKVAIAKGWNIEIKEMTAALIDYDDVLVITNPGCKQIRKHLNHVVGGLLGVYKVLLGEELVNFEKCPYLELPAALSILQEAEHLNINPLHSAMGTFKTGLPTGTFQTVVGSARMAGVLADSGQLVMLPKINEELCLAGGIPVIGIEDLFEAMLLAETATAKVPSLCVSPGSSRYNILDNLTVDSRIFDAFVLSASGLLSLLVVVPDNICSTLWAIEMTQLLPEPTASEARTLAEIWSYQGWKPPLSFKSDLIVGDLAKYFVDGYTDMASSLSTAYHSIAAAKMSLFGSIDDKIWSAVDSGFNISDWGGPVELSMIVQSSSDKMRSDFNLVATPSNTFITKKGVEDGKKAIYKARQYVHEQRNGVFASQLSDSDLLGSFAAAALTKLDGLEYRRTCAVVARTVADTYGIKKVRERDVDEALRKMD